VQRRGKRQALHRQQKNRGAGLLQGGSSQRERVRTPPEPATTDREKRGEATLPAIPWNWGKDTPRTVGPGLMSRREIKPSNPCAKKNEGDEEQLSLACARWKGQKEGGMILK